MRDGRQYLTHSDLKTPSEANGSPMCHEDCRVALPTVMVRVA